MAIILEIMDGIGNGWERHRAISPEIMGTADGYFSGLYLIDNVQKRPILPDFHFPDSPSFYENIK